MDPWINHYGLENTHGGGNNSLNYWKLQNHKVSEDKGTLENN